MWLHFGSRWHSLFGLLLMFFRHFTCVALGAAFSLSHTQLFFHHSRFESHILPTFILQFFNGFSFWHSQIIPGVFRAMDRAAISQQSLSTLLLLLLWIIQELCNRFRVPLGDNPQPAQVQPPPAPVGAHPVGNRCAHQCDHCASHQNISAP